MPKRAEPSSAKRCAICNKPVVEAFRPFCSKRCADVDLNRWLSGVYAIPVKEEDDEDGTRAEGREPKDR
ncbi:MAG: DNA gyrase inhibitor YacG [Xanthobacteraceae bacterium]